MITLRTISLSFVIATLISLSACSCDNVDNDNDTIVKKPSASEPITEEVEVNEPSIEASVEQTASEPVPEKQDLVDLLGWFEEGCGFGQYMTDAEPVPSAIDQRYEAFKNSFMTYSYTPEDEYIATVTRDYALPEAYRDAVKDISVKQDDDGVSYTVKFSDATYRGYDLDKLEIFYAPESDYLFDVLYFKNDDFMALKPQFKGIEDMNYDDQRIGVFDAKAKTVLCYLGL